MWEGMHVENIKKGTIRMRLKYILIILSAVLTSCSLEIGVVQNITNDSIQLFSENQDFNSEKLDEYKIREAIVCPFFRNSEDDIYSFHISAYSKNNQLRSATIISYNLKIAEDDGVENISETINKKIIFKPHWDKKDWDSDVLFAGLTVFEDKRIELNENSKVKLVIKIEVESDEGVEVKELKYDFRYEEDRYLVNLSQ